MGSLGCASSRGEQGGLDRRPKPPWQARKTPAGGPGFIRHSRISWSLDGGQIADALAEGRLVLECRQGSADLLGQSRGMGFGVRGGRRRCWSRCSKGARGDGRSGRATVLAPAEAGWSGGPGCWRQRKTARRQENCDLARGAFVVVGDDRGAAQAFGQVDDITVVTLTRLTEQEHGAFRVPGATSVLAQSTAPSDPEHPAFPTARQSSRRTSGKCETPEW